MRQASLQMTGKTHVDEYGKHDRWNRGGVYDKAGEFDLKATEKLLTERFQPVSERLPESVGEYERKPSQRAYHAVYYRCGEFENTHGVTVDEQYVRIFPVGPHLHQWTCGIEERTPKYATNPRNGWGSWHHPDANNEDEIGTAVATALAVMRGEIDSHIRRENE